MERTLSRIDRAFVNRKWIDRWLEAKVEFYRWMVGDHASMNIVFSSIPKDAGPFKIYNSWLGKPEFLNLAKRGIANPICGNSLFKLQ